jgi:hypothetical protein
MYDLNLVKRRAWLFIPFFLLGLIVAFVFVSVAGDANAVASLQIETIVHDAVIGGDRGLRIFEAEAMTTDVAFKAKVRTRIGNAQFDYARFSISLNPISVADGVSRGVLTVSVTDPKKAQAELFRQAWVDTFIQEYTADDGLFRTRFIETSTGVAVAAEAEFQRIYTALKPAADAKGIPLAALLEGGDASLVGQLNVQEADLTRQLYEIQGALQAYGSSLTSPDLAAVTSSLLKTPVDATSALGALRNRATSLQLAIQAIRQQRTALSDVALDAAFLSQVDELRGARDIKGQSYVRLANANVAVRSARSDVESSYSLSGGIAGTMQGRIAVAVAFTLVFGIIAIYTVEWLSQLRRQGDS